MDIRSIFGVGEKRLSRSIQGNRTERLSTLSRKFSKKSPEQMNDLVEKTIKTLGSALSKSDVQSVFIGFVADLSQDDNGLLKKVFDKNIVSYESLKKAFVSAIISDHGTRALKLAVEDPNLLFEPVREKKPAYTFFNEQALNFLLKSGAINDEFLIGLLK